MLQKSTHEYTVSHIHYEMGTYRDKVMNAALVCLPVAVRKPLK